ncbi:MAG: ligase-associated DNA damage response exonuclease [Chitinophagaceae bacterium]
MNQHYTSNNHLISFTDKGLYCAKGDFYIDPWKPVEKAIITHAHSDHARWGSQQYLCHHYTKPLLQQRLGNNHYQSVEYNQPINMNGVEVTFFPAGHIVGSAQIRLSYEGEIWVFSGDYKLENDTLSTPFEPVQCHTFITESTFGLPIYQWKEQMVIYKEMQDWIIQNQLQQHASVFIAYSLGKAQRVLQAAAAVTDNIYVHGAIWNMHEAIEKNNIHLPTVKKITSETSKSDLKNAVIIAPPSAEATPWMKKLQPYKIGICSGWMQVRGNSRRRNADAGFVLSDHADWNGLLTAIKATNAEKVFVTHGFQTVLTRYLNENGIEAAEVKTDYGHEEEDANTEKSISN